MARTIWKGAISFGLVHVPVGLHTATRETGVDFDWIDKRSNDPVGYKRVNKRTGREVPKEAVVRGIQQSEGEYVILSDDEIKSAFPLTTQTIAIELFAPAAQIPFYLLEKPYYLEPLAKGERVYTLLREAMLDAGVIGIGRVVMHSKEHLAALVATPRALMLNTIRWGSELVAPDDIDFPAAGKSAAKLKPGELKMARQLIEQMRENFEPKHFDDAFTEAIHALVKKKLAAGKTATVEPLEAEPEASRGDNVVDLTELLQRSLAGKAGGTARKRPSRQKSASKSVEKVPKKTTRRPSKKAA